jgi:uncharacterized protein
MAEAGALVQDAGLADRVLGLARELRRAGAPVAPTEVADALESLRRVPLERRQAVRAALSATLCKDPSARTVFNRLFPLWFPLLAPDDGGASDDDAGRSSSGDDAHDLARAIADDDAEELRRLARRRVRELGEVRSDARVSPDASAFRALRGLNLESVLAVAHERTAPGHGQGALERTLTADELRHRMDEFRQLLRDEVTAALLDDLSPEELAARERRPPPDEIDFLWATEADLERMRDAVAPLARRLASRLTHRRHTAPQGRLDIRRTLRRSLSTGGAPIDPQFRRPVAGRPEVVVLCDLSGSMRTFARFTMELTYALSDQLAKVRVFAFIDAVDEITGVLSDATDLATALDRVASEARIVAFDGQSWYGHVLEQFCEEWLDELGPRSTVLVLGDARGNFRSSGAAHLHDVRDRVRRVYWLNPEPREHWGSGDSLMDEFAAACDEVAQVRTLEQLEAFIGRIL